MGRLRRRILCLSVPNSGNNCRLAAGRHLIYRPISCRAGNCHEDKRLQSLAVCESCVRFEIAAAWIRYAGLGAWQIWVGRTRQLLHSSERPTWNQCCRLERVEGARADTLSKVTHPRLLLPAAKKTDRGTAEDLTQDYPRSGNAQGSICGQRNGQCRLWWNGCFSISQIIYQSVLLQSLGQSE